MQPETSRDSSTGADRVDDISTATPIRDGSANANSSKPPIGLVGLRVLMNT